MARAGLQRVLCDINNTVVVQEPLGVRRVEGRRARALVLAQVQLARRVHRLVLVVLSRPRVLLRRRK